MTRGRSDWEQQHATLGVVAWVSGCVGSDSAGDAAEPWDGVRTSTAFGSMSGSSVLVGIKQPFEPAHEPDM